jgi:transcription initiation factor TFIID TATA-box-binding protein
VRVVNVVAIAKVKEKFDLSLLSNRIPEAEFPSRGAPWLKMRIQPENYYTAFYRSGKFLITGIRDFGAIAALVERVLDILHKIGLTVHLESIRIQNIVLVDHVELNTSLENIIISNNESGFSYEPEQFPGLFYKDATGISYTLFSSGSLIVTGFTDLAAAKESINRFKALIAI